MAKKEKKVDEVNYTIDLVDKLNETLQSQMKTVTEMSERMKVLSDRIDLLGKRSDTHSNMSEELHRIVEIIRGRMGL
jgi:prefoldin subunit 5